MNLFDVAPRDGALALAGYRLQPEAALLSRLEGAAAAGLRLGLRPEFVRLAAPGEPGAVEADVLRLQDLGASLLLTAAVHGEPGMQINARLEPGTRVAQGRQWLRLLAPETVFFAGDRRIEL